MHRHLFAALCIYAASLPAYAQTYRILVNDKGWGYINLQGEKVIPSQRSGKFSSFTADGIATVYLAGNSSIYFIDTSGNRIHPSPSYHINTRAGIDPDEYNSGLVPFQYKGKWGYLNTKCGISIEPKYAEAKPFSEGFASVKIRKEWAIINATGNEKMLNIPGISDIKKFQDGLAAIIIDGQTGFIDTTGSLVISAKYHSVGYFNGGIAWARVVIDNLKRIGFIDRKGKWILDPIFETVDDYDPTSGYARVKIKDGWVYMKMDGSIMKPAEGNKFRDFKEGLAMAELNDLVGFLGPNGKWAIMPAFSDGRHFKNGYAAVKQDGKWGITNKKGEWVVKPTYDAIRDVEVIE